jgi:diamine N-acetyltransferase
MEEHVNADERHLPDPGIRLVEITQETLSAVLNLKVTEVQSRFVATNAISIAQAHFEPSAWFRAVAEDDRLVGFAMVFDQTLPGAAPDPELGLDIIMLWRFMIDAEAQGRGIGRRALDLVADYARTRPGITRFATTYGLGPGGPRDFYLHSGFVETGRILDGETEAIRPL